MSDLFLVFGGELVDIGTKTFKDVKKIHMVGAFDSKEKAQGAWRANAQRTVDNALMRYFVVPLSEFGFSVQ